MDLSWGPTTYCRPDLKRDLQKRPVTHQKKPAKESYKKRERPKKESYYTSKKTNKRDLQKGLIDIKRKLYTWTLLSPYILDLKRDLLHVKRDLQKRLAKETYKGDPCASKVIWWSENQGKYHGPLWAQKKNNCRPASCSVYILKDIYWWSLIYMYIYIYI